MPKKNKKKDTSLLVDGLPPKLKRDFKSACAKTGVSMKDVIVNAMTKTVLVANPLYKRTVALHKNNLGDR